MGNTIKIYKESPKSLEGPRHCDLWMWKWMESMENHHQLLVGPLSMGAPILMQIHPTFRQVLISRILILARDVATVLGSLFTKAQQ